MDGRTDKLTNERTNERTKVPCVLQDFVPFGAAAQKAAPLQSWGYFSNVRIFMSYSMIVLNCNIRWGHSAKTRRASKILKKLLENMSLQIIAGKFQGFSGKNMILLFLFNLRSKYAKWKNHCRPPFLITSEGTFRPKMEKQKTPNLIFRVYIWY